MSTFEYDKNPMNFNENNFPLNMDHMDQFSSLRKFGRHRTSQSTIQTIKKQNSNIVVKAEPQSTVKKVINFDSTAKIPANPKTSPPASSTPPTNNFSTLSGIEQHSDSSVCILPSQPDDIIIVDETNDCDLNIDSAALFDEMLLKSDEPSDFLKKIEKKCISNLKNQTDKGNAAAKAVPNKALNLQWNCKECEKYYAVAGRSLSDEELQKRLKNCQTNHRSVSCETPEGFWNPCFPPTPEDDPRFMTLIDVGFTANKNNNK